MPILTYECNNGHQFEKEGGRDRVKCPTCRSLSEILWVSPRSPHRQLQTPIVMWRYPDGSLGIAGGADSITPKTAERVEIRSAGEYRRYAKELNQQRREIDEKKETQFQEHRERMEREKRSSLAWMMGQESDPVAREIYREALNTDRRAAAPSFQEFFSMAMEMDKSNYE